jgi:hypothetical protein
VNIMNESKPSTYFTGDGPQISMCIISKIPALRLTSHFLTCLAYFPLMQSLQ